MSAMAMAKKTLGLESVADLEARRATICEDAAAIYSAVEELKTSKSSAETFERHSAIETEIAKKLFQADRLARDLQVLDADLVAAREKVRQRRREEILRGYEPALRKLVAAAESLRPAMDAVVGIRQGLIDAGFEREAREMLVPPHIAGSPLVLPDFVEKIEAEIVSFRNGRFVERIPATPGTGLKVVAQTRLPHEPIPITDTQRPVYLGFVDPRDRPPSQAPRAPRRESRPGDPGFTLVRYQRNNVELPDGVLSVKGDQVAVSKSIANALAKQGAAIELMPGEEMALEGAITIVEGGRNA